ncbi:hypothetical protein GO986_12025 [Deinococcus sp. HMF7620]|uniref:Uncharacterized protein n=1 Tax=Deinococcus arboris TaxID=2682977 RepID=A0A7C9HS67_9DEIO|nr:MULTISPECIES: hypothetical protein [Deinococcus]MBZ9752156.1 hypothetical protein [Deinococcus betulae]MVN87492.1 hypothetical protein [Deinococcus arboris]
MNILALHKRRATRLHACLHLQSPALTRSHALEAIAAAHGVYRWAALRAAPDHPVLPLSQARAAAVTRLAELHHRIDPLLIPDDVLCCEPGLDAETALRQILPARWQDCPLPLSGFDRLIVDEHRPLSLTRLGRPALDLSPERVTAWDIDDMVEGLGGLHEERAGLPGTFLIARGADIAPDKLTLYFNHDHGRVGRTLYQRLGPAGHAVIIGPSHDYLGPRLRDVARTALEQGADVHTFEWTGGLTGAGAAPGPGLQGIRRVVADDFGAALRTLSPRAGRRTVAIVETQVMYDDAVQEAHARAIVELAAREVQVIVGAYAQDVESLRELPGGATLLSDRWAPSIFMTTQLPQRP